MSVGASSLKVLSVGAGLLTAALLVVPQASADVNAVINPGFEAGVSGWRCASTATAVTGHAKSGSYALSGATTSSDVAQCTQNVAVSPNTSYTLSAQVNGSYVYLGVTGGASTWTPGTGGAYQNLSLTFTTSASASSVEIFLHGWYGQSTFYADDVALPVAGTTPPTTQPTPTPTEPGANLPACRHFSDSVPPERPAGPSHDSATQAPRINLSGRLAAPGNVQGRLANGAVTITFDRVAGAVAYRVWRNSQSVVRIDDWGQAVLSVTDASPCRDASYTVVALRSDDNDASLGQLSAPYRLLDSGTLGPGALTSGTRLTYKITAYNDGGQTASGYNAGLGICAVDTRYIPWGTRMSIDGYGYCYAADIGTWIQGEIVDIWLPGDEADAWGVQSRTVTIE